MTKKLTNAQIERIRQQPTGEALDELVRQEMEELQVAGKIYRFKIVAQCWICQDEALRIAVNKMLTYGMRYEAILTALVPTNATRPKNKQITYNNVYTHSKRHFPLDDIAAQVYRSILEKQAIDHQIDIVKGTGSIVNAFSFLETVEAKAYQNLVDPDTKVSVETGMAASLKRHELIKDDADLQAIAKLYQDFNSLVNAVKKYVPQDKWKLILAEIEGGELEPLDVEEAELVAEPDDDGPPKYTYNYEE